MCKIRKRDQRETFMWKRSKKKPFTSAIAAAYFYPNKFSLTRNEFENGHGTYGNEIETNSHLAADVRV